MRGVSEIGAQILKLIDVTKKIKDAFDVEEDFFVKPMLGMSWEITSENNFYLLKFGLPDEIKESCLIVKKEGNPLIAQKDEYTMAVALDCVKICFILENSRYNGTLPDKF